MIEPRPFGGLKKECEKRDIGSTLAFSLARQGLIETFKLSTRRYVYIDSLETLNERCAAVGYEPRGMSAQEVDSLSEEEKEKIRQVREAK